MKKMGMEGRWIKTQGRHWKDSLADTAVDPDPSATGRRIPLITTESVSSRNFISTGLIALEVRVYSLDLTSHFRWV